MKIYTFSKGGDISFPLIKYLIIMKLIFLILLFALKVNAATYAQTISLSKKNISIENIFREIKKQAKYNFICKTDILKATPLLSIHVEKVSLKETLDQLFLPIGLSYVIENKTVVVTSSVPVKESSLWKQKKISGKVIDGTGQPLIGVTVKIKNTNTAVATNSAGAYSILVDDPNAILVFSFIGYKIQEIPVGNQSVINITLADESSSLNELVVVGMDNRQTKRSLTGAVSTIQTKELKQSPVANLSNALAGRLPGLITVQSNGEPGSDGANLYIRGIATYGNSAPLVVIDGLPRAQTDFNQLDANEIESVTILKDAASSALYGIQGANGVVVVSTKRGSSSTRPEINFTAQQAIQQPIRLPRMMETYDQALYFKELDANASLPVRYSDQILDIIRTGSDPYQYPNVNWFDVVLKDQSMQSQYNLNLSGSANDKIRYFVSGSYIKQGTLLRHGDIFEDNYGVTSKFDRYNFRSNIDLNATKMLDLRIDLAGRLENRTGPGPGFSEVFSDITSRSPSSQPVFNPDGTLGAGSALEIPYHVNPYGMITESGYYTSYTNVMYGTLSAKHKLDFITEGLNAQLFFSFENNNYRNTSRTQKFDSFWYRGVNNTGEPVYQQSGIKSRLATSGSSLIQRYNYLDFRLNYDKTVGDHGFIGQILANRTLRIINDELPYAYQGVSGHFTYNFKSKYFAEINLGYNGSENFPKEKRYGFFPAVSVGWVMSDESFLKNSDFVRFLKIRGSHGVAGNDKIGGDRWLYISDFAPGGGYRFGVSPSNAAGYTENRAGNINVTWEEAVKTNIGFDLTLLPENVLQFTFDVFREKRDNILTAPGDVPGFVAIRNMAPRNSGVVLNKGYEGELRFNKKFGNWRVFSNIQLTYARNKVLENDQPKPAFPYQDLRGYEVGYVLGYKSLGFFKDVSDVTNSPRQSFSSNVIPGDIKYRDVNGDKVINEFDRMPIQVHNVPRYIGGISIGASYKGFDFSMLINGAKGATAYTYLYPGSRLNLDRWSPDNLDARVPVANSSSNNTLTTDLFVQKSDYLKLRNAEIGFELPGSILNPLKIKYARIYVNGQNLAVWDSLWLKDRDPESAGSQAVNYPLQRIMNLGVNVRF